MKVTTEMLETLVRRANEGIAKNDGPRFACGVSRLGACVMRGDKTIAHASLYTCYHEFHAWINGYAAGLDDAAQKEK